MAISDEISRLQTAKSAIKGAIEEKGVLVPENITLSTYDQYILQIKTQGLYEIKEVTPNAIGQIVTPSEGYDALSQVIVNGDLNLVSSNIKDGVTIFGITGSLSVTPNLQEKSATPSTSSQTITPDDGYDGLSSVTVNGDYNLVPDNIKEGVSIFGVTGSFAGGGGGSSDYNVFVQTSEPEKKDGIWIKGSADISKGTYFTPDFTKKENFLDENFSYMNVTATVIGQVVVGDYLYSFGTNSANSYAYNIRTRQVIGNLNVPTVSVNNKWQAIYYEKLNCIYVVYNSSGSNNPISWYAYYIDSNTSSSIQTKTTGDDTRVSASCGLNIYNDVIYVLHRGYSSHSYRCYLQKINAETNTYISGKNVAVNAFDTYAYTQGKYIYWTIYGDLYIFDCSTETITSKTLYSSSSSIYETMGWAIYCIVAGDKVYLFSTNTTYYCVYDLSNNQIELKTKNINVPVEWGYNPYATNLTDGLVYIRNANFNTIAFQIGEDGIANYPDNSLLVIPDLSNLKYVKIDNNSGLRIGIKDTYVKENESLENYLTFWGDGEKWNLLKNPAGETATVTFDTGGGSAVSSQEVIIGSKVSKPDDPTKDNYVFGDWYLDGKIFDFSTPITGNITLTASWLTYEVIDYIESSGTQYIDTGLKPNQNIKVQSRYVTSDFNSYIIGCWTNGNKNRYQYMHRDVYFMGFGDIYDNTITSDKTITPHTIEIDNGTFKLDGNILKALASTAFDNTAINMYLFACDTPDGANNFSSGLKIFYLKIYDNGTLIRNFIPIKTSDGVYALLDQVNNKAYYNAGTGSFTGGNLLEPVQLSYIESTGTQYIDTGVVPNSNIKIKTNIMAITLNSSNYCSWFGSSGTGIRAFVANGKFYFTVGNSTETTTSVLTNTKYNVVVNDGGKCYVDGNNLYTGNPSGISETSTIKIFAINTSENIWGSARVYDFKIYDGETLVRDFVPWKDEYGIICLHDNIENKNYYNKGNGTFTGE